MDLLPDRAAWYVVGPLIGLLVAGMFALANKPLGASGAYVQTIAALRKRASEPWRAWYFAGILAGAVVASALQGRLQLRSGYELMLGVWPLPATIVVLVIGGVVMGYGARMAGGCTSGHGLCGTSARSAASFSATATFMGVAIVVTFALNWFTGGRL
jgi:uncharacterized membrane protein YedE/YeeE